MSSDTQAKKIQRSFRLSAGTLAKLEMLARQEYRDATNMVEALIERAASQEVKK